MRVLFDGLPLDKISTSMTINAPAAMLLLMYQLVAEEQGVSADRLAGTIQNDVLEYIARGTYIYPPKASLRLISDIFAYCNTEMPRWNTISISATTWPRPGRRRCRRSPSPSPTPGVRPGRHRRGPGRRRLRPRLSFFFVARTTLLEEVAKFAPPGGSGRGSCARSSARRTPSR